MKFAFFDTKPYDVPAFDRYGSDAGIEFKYFETKLNEDTVDLARGYDGVCAFVNDTVNAAVIDRLNEMGIGVLALKELLLLARRLGITNQGMDENGVFGDGTRIAVDQVLKKGGYEQNGIAGEKFMKYLAKLIKEKTQ